MPRQSTLTSILLAIVLLLLALAALFVAYIFYFATYVSLVTLPGGHVAVIDGSFSVSEYADRTAVDAAGRRFVFTPTAITVDGIAVAALDGSAQQVDIDARGDDAELSLNWQRVLLPSKR